MQIENQIIEVERFRRLGRVSHSIGLVRRALHDLLTQRLDDLARGGHGPIDGAEVVP